MNPDPSFPQQTPGGAPPPSGPSAIEALNVPSILLIAGGAIGILFRLGSLVGGDRLTQELLKRTNPGMASSMGSGSGVGNMIGNLLGIVLSGLIVYGGLQMRAGKGFNLAMTAAILGAIPYCGCYPLSMTGGIWALVLLLKPEIKAQFTA